MPVHSGVLGQLKKARDSWALGAVGRPKTPLATARHILQEISGKVKCAARLSFSRPFAWTVSRIEFVNWANWGVHISDFRGIIARVGTLSFCGRANREVQIRNRTTKSSAFNCATLSPGHATDPRIPGPAPDRERVPFVYRVELLAPACRFLSSHRTSLPFCRVVKVTDVTDEPGIQ